MVIRLCKTIFNTSCVIIISSLHSTTPSFLILSFLVQSHALPQNPIICPACTLDGRDVMIRLVCMKGDPSPSGIRHLDILRRVAKGDVACIGNNHIVPVLQELTNDEHGLTFIVQPKLFDIDEFPTWYTAREAADFVVQILEVSAGLA